jgi:hypothetical protein
MTWEIMYSRSMDNGKTWSGTTTGDLRISQRMGNEKDAKFISSPKLVIGTPLGRATEVFHAIWSEMDNKQQQELVHYSRSENGGASWTGQEVDDILSHVGHFARNPDIAYSGAEANFIHATWSQEGLFGFDEIFYRRSFSYGNPGSWNEAMPISFTQDDGMISCDVTISGGAYNDVHAVWKQYPYDKAAESRLFYSSSPDNGLSWTGAGKDWPICDFDGFEPNKPSVAVGDKLVQVVWTEIDEKSPQGTMEIHTSWTDNPLDPESWTGLKGDIVLSNGDEWGPADARNVSMAMGLMKEGWKPVFVWDELNDEPTKAGRVDRNNEIHTNPEAEWTLTVTTSGSGYVERNPDQETYPDGTLVTIMAYAYAGWSFDHWGGDIYSFYNPETIEMTEDISVIAYFTQDQYTLTVNIYGSGSVSKSPNQATYTYGQNVQLTAIPDSGWKFDYWSGAITGSTNPRIITIYSNRVVNAHFSQITYNISLSLGWNLVSLPLEQPDTSVTKVLSSINGKYDSIKYYDSRDPADPWKSYRPDGQNDLTGIDHRMAVWIHTNAECTLTLYGTIPTSTTIQLYTGWNFVGYPTHDTTKTVASALAGTGYDRVEGYQSTAPYLKELKDTDPFLPGQGYWVHVPADTTWTINW